MHIRRLLIFVLAALFPAGLGCLGDVDVPGQADAGRVIGEDGGPGESDAGPADQGGLCDDVVCDTPPGQCYSANGMCIAGICEYAVLSDTPCDDEDSCTTDDTCLQGVCRGTPVLCDDPPANTCAEMDNMRVYNPIGSCVNGNCFYDSTKVFCPEGCQNGLCHGDPCLGVDCSQAPGICYQSPGTCIEGTCSYEPADGKACDDGDPCTNLDQCGGGICQGQVISCNQPPPPECREGQLLVTFGSDGQCRQGECEYPQTLIDCEHGCLDGACQSSSEPAVLSSAHPGWTEQNCFQSGCHVTSDMLPNHESGLEIPACAECHGANGACYTCGRISSCASCHGYKHGFSATSDCRTCHEAAEGLRNCY